MQLDQTLCDTIDSGWPLAPTNTSELHGSGSFMPLLIRQVSRMTFFICIRFSSSSMTTGGGLVFSPFCTNCTLTHLWNSWTEAKTLHDLAKKTYAASCVAYESELLKSLPASGLRKTFHAAVFPTPKPLLPMPRPNVVVSSPVVAPEPTAEDVQLRAKARECVAKCQDMCTKHPENPIWPTELARWKETLGLCDAKVQAWEAYQASLKNANASVV